MRYEQEKDSFRCFYKEHLILFHSLTDPAIYLGVGQGKLEDKLGMYSPIKEQVIEKRPLTTFSVKKETPSELKIDFFDDNKVILTLSLTEKNGRLEINFSIGVGYEYFNRFWLIVPAKNNEAIYGCGEQFSELNLRGKKVPLFSEEQGVGRGDPKILTWILNKIMGAGGYWWTTYYPQPTFVSSANYYIHSETTGYAIFDFSKASRHELYFWEIPKTIFLGKFDSPIETIGNLSELLGRQPPLPEWIYDGMILAIQNSKGLETVEARLKNAVEKGVKVSGVWSQDWQGINQTKYGTNLFWDWKWDGKNRPIRFPNFPEFVKKIGSQNIRYLGYINPYLNTKGDLYTVAYERGFLVKNQAEKEYIIRINATPTGIVDLSNPDAFEWIKSVIKENMILNVGLSGWMADFGEGLPPDCKLHSGDDPKLYHNRYPVEWARANYEAIKELGKLGEIFFFSRSGYSHSSKYSTSIWAGDQVPTFSMDDGLASVIPSALSLGVCGIGYHHSDIGGFSTWAPFFRRNKEVFMRWAEQCAFTMTMRTHESNRPEINPQFDVNDKVLGHLAKMTQIHDKLKPYLLDLSDQYQEKGIPPMRALFLHYNEDPEVHRQKYEYLLGEDLLIAPVIKAHRKTWKVYLPGKNWIHIWSGQVFESGWHRIKAPLGQPPVYYREGSEFEEIFKKLRTFL